MDVTIGNILYQLRVDSGESQEQVADATDISRVAYTRYENGQREPKASAAIRLAQHFGVTVEHLYGKENKTPVLPQNPEEAKLLGFFRELTRENKDGLTQYAEFLIARQTEEKRRANAAG